MVALAHAFFARLRPRDQGYLYIPLVRRVAGQIDGATRRVPKGMAVVLGEARNKVAVRSGRNPNGPCTVVRLAALNTLAVSRYCHRVSALPVGQQHYGATTTGI